MTTNGGLKVKKIAPQEYANLMECMSQIKDDKLRDYFVEMARRVKYNGLPEDHFESIIMCLSCIMYGPLSADLMDFTINLINSYEPDELELIRKNSDYLNFMLTTADIGYNLF